MVRLNFTPAPECFPGFSRFYVRRVSARPSLFPRLSFSLNFSAERKRDCRVARVSREGRAECELIFCEAEPNKPACTRAHERGKRSRPSSVESASLSMMMVTLWDRSAHIVCMQIPHPSSRSAAWRAALRKRRNAHRVGRNTVDTHMHTHGTHGTTGRIPPTFRSGRLLQHRHGWRYFFRADRNPLTRADPVICAAVNSARAIAETCDMFPWRRTVAPSNEVSCFKKGRSLEISNHFDAFFLLFNES